MQNREALAELARRELASRHYAEYLAYAYGDSWIRTRLSSFLAEKIQNFIETDTGHAYDILIIECPPQHGKSMTVSESLPSWVLGKYPEHNIILASYDSDFAERFCRKNKDKIKTCGKSLFQIEIGAIDRAGEFELSNGRGRMISRGIMSGITGNPADLIIIDDPVKNQQEADSPAYRNRVWSEWQASLKSRLAAKGKVIVIMTPWTDDDLAARIIRAEKNVILIRLPVEAEENDPLGRGPGEPLCPELGKDAQWLSDFKASYISDPQGGQRAWTALYQCSPRQEDGNLVKREWWRFYIPRLPSPHGEGAPVRTSGADEVSTRGCVLEPESYGTEMISVDASFKGDDTSDFVSIQVWGKRANDYYLRYCLNKRLNFPDTVEALRTIYRLFPRARTVLIEEAANGPAIIQTLQQEMLILPVTPLGGKVSRVNAVSPAIESGHVYLPDPAKAPWVSDYIDQWTAFPNSKYDDMVDATSQALNRMIYCSGEVWEEQERKQKPIFDVNRLFDPYNVEMAPHV